MSIKTKIEWCDSSVNPVMGCDGCELWNKANRTCYSGNMTARYAGRNGWPKSFDEPEFFAGRIEKAARWADLTGAKRPGKPHLNGMPRIIFVNDMSDSFTESMSTNWLLEAMPIIENSPHIWLFLTKRAKRMAAFFNDLDSIPQNIWGGVTITNQQTANGRIPPLLSVPFAVRFVSAEPLAEVVRLAGHLDNLDWIIAGGESGRNATKMTPAAPLVLHKECKLHKAAFFFKQWGEFNEYGDRVGKKAAGRLLDGREWNEMPRGYHA